MENPFVLPREAYVRDLDLIKGYFVQNNFFLHRMTGQPKQVCAAFLRETVSGGGQYPITDPNMLILRQDSPGNRVKDEMTLLTYVKTVTDSDRILSPSMTCYENPKVLKSPSAKFVEIGIKGRSKAKNEMFLAKVAGDDTLEKIKDAEQNAKKIGINSLSGMHGFTGNILYVKSGHPSLTSMCRAATGYGNASNEKLLAGSRHYWSPKITIANLLALVTSQPHDVFQAAMEECGLVYPTTEQVCEAVLRSTDLYWRNEGNFARIRKFIDKCTPLERAIMLYTGDLYHIAKYNDGYVRGFMDAIIKYDPVTDPEHVEDPYSILRSKTYDGDTNMLATYLNAEFTMGEDFESMKEKGMDKELAYVAKTSKNIQKSVQDYFTFIRVFLTPVQLAPTVANIKDILRRVVLASDTDSTIFTTQDWVTWYTGSDYRSKAGDGIWYTTTYIACQCIIHVLAKLSANMGVVQEDIHRVSMKNEYAFPVFTLTSRAKHYYAFMSAREGRVYREYDMEVKGVALRSSTVAVSVIKQAKAFMKEVMNRADQNRQFTLEEVYHKVWLLEQEIFTSIANGEYRFLKSGQIQESYANMNKENPFMDKSNFRHYHFWQVVFAPKYGNVESPPFTVIKAPLSINNKTDMKEWYAIMDKIDPEMSARLQDYCIRAGKDKLGTLMLPLSILSGIGIPKEIMPVVDVRRLTYEILESFYMILETLGVFQVDSKHVRLVSDVYTPSGEVNLQPAPTEANSALPEEEEGYEYYEEDDDDINWLTD